VSWGIGGSLLLYHLNLISAPQELDIVTTPEDFPALNQRLSSMLGPPAQIAHPTYASIISPASLLA
jgi:hypothetical protein